MSLPGDDGDGTPPELATITRIELRRRSPLMAAMTWVLWVIGQK
jgi:hypothetical protein